MDLFDRILELTRQGFFCSQILMQLGLDADGKENPQLIRAMGGLNGGLGFTENVCGCMTGGCCLLSYFLGKGEGDELEDPEFRQTLGGFVKWFEAKSGDEFGGVTCRDITGGGVGRRLEHCPGLISDSFEKCMEILSEKGVV